MKHCAAFAFLLLLPASAPAQGPELRGVWMTPRSGSGFWSKQEIARAMDSVADNNFNLVYFNAWSRGWPLWRSEVFFQETGYATDPTAGERDILQEAIAEAHRRGIELEAWMEYGFVAWWSGNNLTGYPKGPLLAAHPSWHARDKAGNDAFPSGHVGSFYWMSHNHPEVQAFLIRLHGELAERYDVDGIELDRIRYPQLDCGYDSVSVAIYTAEKGVPPPTIVTDPGWMRWRADRINAFHRAAYDSLKRSNPHVVVSNAPSHYTSGSGYPAYESFLQDWLQWVNTGSVDNVQIQMYVQPNLLAQYIPSALSGVDPARRDRAYAGIAVVTSSYTLTPAENASLVTTVRDAGMQGNSYWYYNDLQEQGYFLPLRSQVYQSPVDVPGRSSHWRELRAILDDTSAVRSEGWTVYTLPPTSPINAWAKTFATSDATAGRQMEYRFTVPASGFYEVYVHIPDGLLNLTSRAPVDLIGSGGTAQTVLVDQTRQTYKLWHKLGDLDLAAGNNVPVVRVRSDSIGAGKFVVADAVMIILNRRLSPDAVAGLEERRGELIPSRSRLLSGYPNPFNPQTVIAYEVATSSPLRIDVFDSLGRHVTCLVEGVLGAGRHEVLWDARGRASGVYILRLQAGQAADAWRAVLLR